MSELLEVAKQDDPYKIAKRLIAENRKEFWHESSRH